LIRGASRITAPTHPIDLSGPHPAKIAMLLVSPIQVISQRRGSDLENQNRTVRQPIETKT